MEDIRIIISETAVIRYQELIMSDRKQDRALKDAIHKRIDILREDPHHGNPISKRLTPKFYKDIGMNSIFRIPLPFYWRMIYTLKNDADGRIIVIIEILSHKEYDKRFNY